MVTLRTVTKTLRTLSLLAVAGLATLSSANAQTFTWGRGEWGQLGNGTSASSLFPTPGPVLDTAKKLSGGFGFSLVLKPGGVLTLCGLNAFGQIGDGTTTTSYTGNTYIGVRDAAAGAHHTVAVASDGLVYAWGLNAFGQLGNGTTTNSSFTVGPLAIGAPVIKVAAGGHHSLALDATGVVWAWGYNGFGQLGDGTTTDSLVPVPVSLPIPIKAIAAGAYHSVAIDVLGTVWTWGYNLYGQLITGDRVNQLLPYSAGAPMEGLAEVSAGAYHTLFLSNLGFLYAGGRNNDGQLGDGTTANADTPTIISGGGILTIGAGGFHSLAIDAVGNLFTWGRNNFGQLGNGSTISSTSPTLIGSAYGSIVAGGWYHSLTDGPVFPAP